MKRHGNLWEQIISFEGLLRAADTARRGKRFRPAVAAFHFDQEPELWKLDEYEPKKWQIIQRKESLRQIGYKL
jgi:RNA-directed DNA polymerase